MNTIFSALLELCKKDEAGVSRGITASGRACRNLLLLSLFSLVVSCASNKIEPDLKQQPTGAIELDKDWSTFVGFGTSHRDFRYNIAADEDTLFVAGKQGRLYAIEKSTGNRLWYQEFATPITAGVTLFGDTALMANEEGELFAFDVAAREVLWQTALQSELLHSPVTDGAIVIAQMNNGEIYGLDINNGDLLWSVITESPALTQRGTSSPLLLDNLVIAGFATGRLLILSQAAGQRIWQTDVGTPTGINEVGRLVDLDGQHYFDGTTVYSSALHGDLVALDLTGTKPEIRWRTKFSDGSGLVGTSNRIYAINDKGIISSFVSDTGEEVWSNDSMKNYYYNAPVLWQGHLVIGDQLGFVNLFDLTTGQLAGLYRNSPYSVQSNFLAEDDRLYVLDIAGFLSALTVEQ